MRTLSPTLLLNARFLEQGVSTIRWPRVTRVARVWTDQRLGGTLEPLPWQQLR